MAAPTRIPLKALKPHPKNQVLFPPKSVEFIRSLADDINRHGLQEPISVRVVDRGEYLILSGENRFKAVTLLGWDDIDAHIVDPDDELAYLISRNIGRRQTGYSGRVNIYTAYCPDFFQGKKVQNDRLVEVSKKTMIPLATLKSDLKKIRLGAGVKDITMDQLKELWSKKKLKGLRLNLSDMGNGNFLLQVTGKNTEYQWGPGTFREVVRQSAEAAQSKYFDKNFRPENMALAEKIKELRKAAGLTQFQLAQKLGYSQSYFAELEGGKWECSGTLFDDIFRICEERM
ncbi:chromosome partitioning protein [Leptospira langatensis]|uniref:Chromosome partitioning protein n=2 Tax=Leptospira langatensis TaxID=2484983 RepID=A0A5R2AT59_9LEPT|nr:chromosome partitioning protein [Leptospira langatensis]